LELIAARPSGAAMTGVGAFQDDDTATRRGSGARTVEFWALETEQAAEFAFVRSQHDRC
jgi:hypothetical protein